MTQGISKTKFLEIPQDSHIKDPNKEDSDQTADALFDLCVCCSQHMRQEHIYSRYDSFKLPFAEAATVNLIKKVYHGPGHVIADELAYISVFSRS